MARADASDMVNREIRRCHTSDLTAAELRALRGLLDLAFDGEFTDDDWQHGLGGTHVLVTVDGQLVAAGALVRRRFRHDGRSLRCGYVEAVATHPDHRPRQAGWRSERTRLPSAKK